MILEPFSSGYWLAPYLDVVAYGGNDAIIQDAVFDELVAESGCSSPVVYVGGNRYRLKPHWGIPHHVVALPEETHKGGSGDAVLVSKPGRGWLIDL